MPIRVELEWDKFNKITIRPTGKGLQRFYLETPNNFEIRSSDGAIEYITLINKSKLVLISENESLDIALQLWKQQNLMGAIEVIRFL